MPIVSKKSDSITAMIAPTAVTNAEAREDAEVEVADEREVRGRDDRRHRAMPAAPDVAQIASSPQTSLMTIADDGGDQDPKQQPAAGPARATSDRRDPSPTTKTSDRGAS